MCRDRCLTTCEKQHRQNEPAGQVDISTGVEICVMGLLDMCRDLGLPVKNNHNEQLFGLTFLMGWRHGGSQTQVGTTDVSPPVKNNTDRMNQLVG